MCLSGFTVSIPLVSSLCLPVLLAGSRNRRKPDRFCCFRTVWQFKLEKSDVVRNHLYRAGFRWIHTEKLYTERFSITSLQFINFFDTKIWLFLTINIFLDSLYTLVLIYIFLKYLQYFRKIQPRFDASMAREWEKLVKTAGLPLTVNFLSKKCH